MASRSTNTSSDTTVPCSARSSIRGPSSAKADDGIFRISTKQLVDRILHVVELNAVGLQDTSARVGIIRERRSGVALLDRSDPAAWPRGVQLPARLYLSAPGGQLQQLPLAGAVLFDEEHRPRLGQIQV